MTTIFPFLTSYDPLGTSEGTLDPLGLYQIADQLAVQLVPAVRERMQRIRFLTAMAVGVLVTEGLEEDPRQRDASAYLVWEWLVVEALIREMGEDPTVWGVPSTLVARRALDQHGYLDARNYLKTPRIFGFHGVYKRLANHLGLVNVHLGAGPNAQGLADAWARGLGLAALTDAKPMLTRWSAAVRRSLDEKPPHTKTGWGKEAWTELAHAFAPSAGKSREKRYLRDLLHCEDDRRLGALPTLWQLQDEFDNEGFREESLHERFEAAHHAFGEVTITSVSIQNLFGERFRAFAEPMDAGDCALALCRHHEDVQRAKSADGKRPWFDRIGQERIYIRQRTANHGVKTSRADTFTLTGAGQFAGFISTYYEQA